MALTEIMEDKNLSALAWQELEQSVVSYQGNPVGTVAARDPHSQGLNYDQVFSRDFAVSAMAFLMHDRPEIVRHFLIRAVELQSREKHMDCFRPAQGLMPASFKVNRNAQGEESLEADFGQKAIGRVAPVDAPLWWLILLRAYAKATGDWALTKRGDFQEAIRLILELALTPRFDMFPTLLVQDGSFMIDRRMGVYGYPIDIQALFFVALRAALETLTEVGRNEPYREAARERLGHLLYHIRGYYWLDLDRITTLNRYRLEEYGEAAANRFNINPDTIPGWLIDWLPDDGGYLAGNLGPSRLDYRFFSGGNLMAIVGSLVDGAQAKAIMRLIETRWDDLIGEMPLKVAFPALEGKEWRSQTGADSKNTPWSYQNAGGWPFLLWLLAAAGLKADRTDLVRESLRVAEDRLAKDQWPEYYDGRHNRLIGKEARLFQTWTCAGYLAAKRLLEKPDWLEILAFEEDAEMVACTRRVQPSYATLSKD